jgi:hypothetical protein
MENVPDGTAQDPLLPLLLGKWIWNDLTSGRPARRAGCCWDCSLAVTIAALGMPIAIGIKLSAPATLFSLFLSPTRLVASPCRGLLSIPPDIVHRWFLLVMDANEFVLPLIQSTAPYSVSRPTTASLMAESTYNLGCFIGATELQ